MAKYISQILKKYRNNNNLTILIFLQKFHWINVKYRLSNSDKISGTIILGNLIMLIKKV